MLCLLFGVFVDGATSSQISPSSNYHFLFSSDLTNPQQMDVDMTGSYASSLHLT